MPVGTLKALLDCAVALQVSISISERGQVDKAACMQQHLSN